MDGDYKRFCLKCGWLDEDFGCICPSNEEVWQCPMYIHYHPEEVEEWFEKPKKYYKIKKGGDSIADLKDGGL